MKYKENKNEPIASFEIKQISSVNVNKKLLEKLKKEIENGEFIWKAILSSV